MSERTRQAGNTRVSNSDDLPQANSCCRGPLLHVKKTRKVTLQIEHREISFSTVKGAARPGPRPSPPSALAALASGLPSACPTCGAPAILPLAAALVEPEFSLELFQQSVAGHRIHLGQTPAGEWWVCRQSLHSK
jgi:hypothetical protein